MSLQELLGRLADDLPAPVLVKPLAFLEDELLPLRITLVEPAAFVLACVQAAWGPYGPPELSDGDPHTARTHRGQGTSARP